MKSLWPEINLLVVKIERIRLGSILLQAVVGRRAKRRLMLCRLLEITSNLAFALEKSDPEICVPMTDQFKDPTD